MNAFNPDLGAHILDASPLSLDERLIASRLPRELPIAEEDAVITYGNGLHVTATLRVYGDDRVRRITLQAFRGEPETDITGLYSNGELDELVAWMRHDCGWQGAGHDVTEQEEQQ